MHATKNATIERMKGCGWMMVAMTAVTVGAIAGDAGKGAAIGATSLGLTGGMRSRRAMKAAGGASDSAVALYQQQFATWNRNFMAAMEAKGYTVR